LKISEETTREAGVLSDTSRQRHTQEEEEEGGGEKEKGAGEGEEEGRKKGGEEEEGRGEPPPPCSQPIADSDIRGMYIYYILYICIYT
jgi:hypothetical protein